jgi:hypothetical protein
MKTTNFKMKVLFIKEKDVWVVFCLEHSLVAHGSTIEKAMGAFEKVVVSQVALNEHFHEKPFSGCKPAPALFQKTYEIADRLSAEQNEKLVARPFSLFFTPKAKRVAAKSSATAPKTKVPQYTPPAWLIDGFRKADIRIAKNK